MTTSSEKLCHTSHVCTHVATHTYIMCTGSNRRGGFVFYTYVASSSFYFLSNPHKTFIELHKQQTKDVLSMPFDGWSIFLASSLTPARIKNYTKAAQPTISARVRLKKIEPRHEEQPDFLCISLGNSSLSIVSVASF